MGRDVPVRTVPAATWEAIGTRYTLFVTDNSYSVRCRYKATGRHDELSNQPEIDRGDSLGIRSAHFAVQSHEPIADPDTALTEAAIFLHLFHTQ